MTISRLVSRSPQQAQLRAVVKTLCYRLFMIVVTVSIAFLVTGSVGEAVSIGLATNLLKTGTYYVYERAWDRITWGVPHSQPDPA